MSYHMLTVILHSALSHMIVPLIDTPVLKTFDRIRQQVTQQKFPDSIGVHRTEHVQPCTGHVHSLKRDRLGLLEVLGDRQRDSWWQQKCTCSTCLELFGRLRLQIFPWWRRLNHLDWTWVCLKFRVQQVHCYITGALPSPLKVSWQTKPQSEVWQDFSFLPSFPISQKNKRHLSLCLQKPTSFQAVNTLAAMSELKQKKCSFFFLVCLFVSGPNAKGNASHWLFLKMLFLCLFKPGDSALTNISPYGALKHNPGAEHSHQNKCFFFSFCEL